MQPRNMNNSKKYTIQQLSEKLNIPRPTLRFWEKEFEGMIAPLRTPGGQRRYTEEHISVISSIKELRNMGKSISEIRDILSDNHNNNLEIHDTNIQMLSDRISQIVMAEVSKFLSKKSI